MLPHLEFPADVGCSPVKALSHRLLPWFVQVPLHYAARHGNSPAIRALLGERGLHLCGCIWACAGQRIVYCARLKAGSARTTVLSLLLSGRSFVLLHLTPLTACSPRPLSSVVICPQAPGRTPHLSTRKATPL